MKKRLNKIFNLYQNYREIYTPSTKDNLKDGIKFEKTKQLSVENKNNHRCRRYRILYLGNCIFAIRV